jgi:hypothetical protein
MSGELESDPPPTPPHSAQLDERAGSAHIAEIDKRWGYARIVAIEQAIVSWLGDGEELLAYASCWVYQPPDGWRRKLVADGLAVTNRRLLLLRARDHQLLLVDQLPRGEARYVSSGKVSESDAHVYAVTFEAREQLFRIVGGVNLDPRLVAVSRALRLDQPAVRGPALIGVPVRIGQIDKSDWWKPIRRQPRVEQELKSWLGDQDQLVACVTGRVEYMSEQHMDDEQVDGIAVTRRRTLLFKSLINADHDWSLWLVGELPLRDVAVVRHKELGHLLSLLGSHGELILTLRERTLRMRVGRLDARALAAVASALPQGPPRLSGIPAQ